MKNKISINLKAPLVEIILSVVIFAVAGAIMLKCFAAARFTQIKSNDKVAAGNILQSCIEMIKSFEDTDDMEEYLTDDFTLIKKDGNEHIYVNYYDKDWNICGEKSEEYSVTLLISNILTDYGEMKEISIRAEKSKPYPFISNGNEKSSYIYELETTKFFPEYESGW